MSRLLDMLREKIPGWRTEIREMVRDHGDAPLSAVTPARLLGGLRDVRAVRCDTSVVDPQEGLLIRGIPVRELADRGAEELFFLMCIGERPDPGALAELAQTLQARRKIPEEFWSFVASLPEGLSPMRMFSMGVLALAGHSSVPPPEARSGPRPDFWESVLEEALDLLARLPTLCAGIYRIKRLGKPPIPPSADLDFAENWAKMLGLDGVPGFVDFLRTYIVMHGDHEGANASVLAARVVNSTRADLYGSLSAAMNGLAGPLHGLASQTSLEFIDGLLERHGPSASDEAIERHVREMLSEKKVVPGFGHAALRGPDPRYAELMGRGRALGLDDPGFRILQALERVVPPLLKEQGKVKMPHPNVDAATGVLLRHFGMDDPGFLTVMFSTAQAVGLCAQLVLAQAMMEPIIRPRSVTTEWLRARLDGKSAAKSTESAPTASGPAAPGRGRPGGGRLF
jgi:citrate synthase